MRGKMIAFLFFISLIPSIATGVSAYGYELYLGGTHSHTSYSDGKATPSVAYDTARYKANLDFWAVTDHYEQLDSVKDAPADSPKKEWDAMKKTAAEKTENGKFVALAGYEWFDQSKGHMNVLNSDALAPYGMTYTLAKMRKWIVKHPDILVGFNHPGDPDFKNKFDNFAFNAETASQTVYVGVNMLSDFDNYFMALDQGWRVGPVGEQDNHDADWGLKNLFTGVYADELTYEGLMDAFRARRFYSTSAREMTLWFDADGNPMGSVIGSTGKVTFNIDVKKIAESGFRVVVYTNGGEVVKEWQPGPGEFKTELAVENGGASKWYVVAAQNDKGAYSISAPIWINADR